LRYEREHEIHRGFHGLHERFRRVNRSALKLRFLLLVRRFGGRKAPPPLSGASTQCRFPLF
jgi:hypothetical protein